MGSPPNTLAPYPWSCSISWCLAMETQISATLWAHEAWEGLCIWRLRGWIALKWLRGLSWCLVWLHCRDLVSKYKVTPSFVIFVFPHCAIGLVKSATVLVVDDTKCLALFSALAHHYCSGQADPPACPFCEDPLCREINTVSSKIQEFLGRLCTIVRFLSSF